MKTIFTILATMLITLGIFAQSLDRMNYQAVLRDQNNSLVTNTNVGVQISILQGSSSGNPVYVERHFPITNVNGLISFEIGNGTIISGDMTNIDWENGPYFIKAETDLNGGSNYTISGTSQILSVPYAMHAKTAESAEVADNTITSEKIKDGEVKSADIASGSVGTNAVANNAITSSKIKDGEVKSADIGFGAVGASEIANGSILNQDISSIADIAASKIFGDVGVEYTLPSTYYNWGNGEYSAKTLASITMSIPQSGYVILIHTGFANFFSKNRTMAAGIGTSATTILNSVSFGYLDGSSTERYEVPYSITSVVEVTAGTKYFYAIGEGNSVFKNGAVNMSPKSFIGIFIPKKY